MTTVKYEGETVLKMKINTGRFLLALMLLMLSLAACGGDDSPPTTVPSDEPITESEEDIAETETESNPTVTAADPTVEQTEVPTVVAAPEEEMEATPVSNEGDMTSAGIEFSMLQGPFGSGWLWASYTDENDVSSPIEDPSKYILIIGEDNSLVAVGDCNAASGKYTIEGDQFAAELEPGELTTCEEGSRSEQFLELLAQGGSLSVNDDALTIELPEKAGTLGFIANDPQAALRVETWEEAAEKFLESCDAPGVVMLVDEPRGRFLQAYGLANSEDGTLLQTDDRFEIGGNTKSFTVVLALQLQEEGIWSLDDPLSQWLPDPAARIPNGGQVTLRHLASNTSGIWDYADPLIGALIENGGDLEQAYTPEELIDYVVENGEPSFAPGEGAEYSSTNFILLGEAIEAATGEALADLYRERIFDPLGMENSSLLEGVPEDGAIVNGYYTLPSGEVLNTTDENGSQMWAAGGIISTAEDMAKYAAALLSGSLFQDFDSTIQMTDFGDEFVGTFSGYGLGVGKWSDEPLAWGHGGQTAGFQTLFAIFPSSLTNVVLLTNSASCNVSGLMGIIQASPALLPTEEDLLVGLELPTFPLPEPAYSNKRPRDLEPFALALNDLTPERIAELDVLLAGKTIPEIQVLMDEVQLTSEELVTYYVSRIDQYDIDKLNSVMELNPEALDIAASLDAERLAGASRGAMHGIPVLLKDNIATGDEMHTTAGAYALKDWQADRDAFLVQQLREAGALILGKANLSEWANYTDPSMPSGFSTLGGQTRHPYGPFDPLGSSTGSAVSVAANLTTVSVGTETQGSIIQPAASNGVVAIKTSRGLVSRDHIIPLVDWMDVPGPMGRSVTDVAVLLTAMSGLDENDPATADAAELAGTDFSQFATLDAARGKRVGIPITSDETVESLLSEFELAEDAAEEQRQSFAAANAAWREIGAQFMASGIEVIEIDSEELPNSPDPTQVFEFGFQDSVNRFLDGLGSNAPVSQLAEVVTINEEDPENRVPYGQGYITGSVNTAVTADEYAALVQENQETAVAGLRSLFETYKLDAIVVSSFSQSYAAAGYPAITVPNGLDADGAPSGLILVGDFLGEADLIAVAYAFEQSAQGRVEPDLDATLLEIESILSGDESSN
ncbi:MAG: amidase family protein [Candidatus Promineifilaceae bacterium]